VAAGKTEIREVAPVSAEEERDLLAQGTFAVLDALPLAPQSRRRSRAATFVATVDYTPTERLHLLIQAIRRAIRDTADMELAVANELVDGGVASAEVERPDGRDSWKVSGRDAQSRVSHARSLDAALHALESAI
jgi:hypothetical protein